MVEIHIAYEGELRCSAVHGPSATQFYTDAPIDNHGKGESFSPTDLVATALGTCMLTVMGIAARTLQIDLQGTKVTVVKEMVAKPIRRIGALKVLINVPVSVDAVNQQQLVDAAMRCPVKESLHPDVQMPIEFLWK